MIKKNTKVIFRDEGGEREEDWKGGAPLYKGEIVHMHQKEGDVVDYEVVDKKIDCFPEDEDQIVNVVYTLQKK